MFFFSRRLDKMGDEKRDDYVVVFSLKGNSNAYLREKGTRTLVNNGDKRGIEMQMV